MQRGKEDIVAAIGDVLCPIAMMEIDIEDRNTRLAP